MNPFALMLAFSLAKAAPHSLLTYLYPEVIDVRVTSSIGIDNIPGIIVLFNCLYGLFVASLVVIFWACNGYGSQREFILSGVAWAKAYRPKRADVFVAAVLAAALFGLKWVAMGGTEATIFGDELDRNSVGTGMGYIFGPADFSMTLACLLSMLRYRSTSRRIDLGIFICLFVFAAISFSLTGGRKALLQHAIISMALWNLAGGSVRLFSPKFLAIGAAAIAYFLIVLEVRLAGTGRELLSQHQEILAFAGVIGFFSNFSYNETYYFLLNHFSTATPYLGQTFLDLLLAPVPSSLIAGKPPIDEGLYVKALVDQVNLLPPSPASEFEGLGGWPPETFGNFLMNFGIYSFWAAGAILGGLYVVGLKIVRHAGVGLLGLYVTFQSALNFQITNLRFVNLLTLVVFGFVICRLVQGVAMLLNSPRAEFR
jgi:hypothetical protein